ncbi:MAG: hypothetical protein RLZZ535_3344, partial [Cyanobacteriota bacterium]
LIQKTWCFKTVKLLYCLGSHALGDLRPSQPRIYQYR